MLMCAILLAPNRLRAAQEASVLSAVADAQAARERERDAAAARLPPEPQVRLASMSLSMLSSDRSLHATAQHGHSLV